jgi:Tol biopolymer transport system component
MSADGRYIVCWSGDPTLVPGDTNNSEDVFRIDTDTGTIIRVNLTSTGAQLARGDLRHPDDSRMSADGRFVVFDTPAAHVVANDTNHASDVFLRGPLPSP